MPASLCLRSPVPAMAPVSSALAADPDNHAAMGNMARDVVNMGGEGAVDEAARLLHQAWRLTGNDGHLIQAATLLPHILADEEAVARERSRIESALDDLLREVAHAEQGTPHEHPWNCACLTVSWRRLSHSCVLCLCVCLGLRAPLVIVNPVTDIEATTFQLAYHGQGLHDRTLHEKLSKLHKAASSHAGSVAPRLAGWQAGGVGSRPVRVGFFSKFFHDNHAHGQLLEVGAFIPLCCVRRVHLTGVSMPCRASCRALTSPCLRSLSCTQPLWCRCVCPTRTRHSVATPIAHHAYLWSQGVAQGVLDAADELIEVPLHPVSASAVLDAARLDVLVFADTTSEALAWAMSLRRTAPVQVAFWGNPVTTGHGDEIDYFMSGDAMEVRLARLAALVDAAVRSGCASW